MDLDQAVIVREIVRKVLEKQNQKNPVWIPVGISNRHVHLSEQDVETLFGKGHQLHVGRELSQPGYYAAEETVTLVGPKGVLSKVRVLGPPRPHTQVEILLSDGYTLGIQPPIQESGLVAGTPCLTIVGPQGAVTQCRGVMAAWRHIHMNSRQARVLGIQDGDFVKVQTQGDRSVTLHQVKVRVDEKFVTEVHLDVEEGNAAGLKNGDQVELFL
ncbi:phosphate propanoyltransferase [Candidatus Formimonas warabiya]|uniref:phosphate propanoyltransferase n=1 Tax=Formimonas warabiya TaxID=1761012 RepID=UPI00202B92A5|nr:phosphate propanoyltransferase [Candidatus Formimonas warabiya]